MQGGFFMDQNKLVDDILDKVPQVKEAVKKVENATGQKIENIAGEIGEKISEAVKENNNGENIDQKDVVGDIANKLFGKKN